MRIGTKSDLLRCLESDLLERTTVHVVDAKITDDAAVVQMLNPRTGITLKEY